MRAKIVKAIMGINQQKKAIIKQRLTSSVSIFFTSPYLIIKIVPRAPIPTTTIDQPTINHLKKSDKWGAPLLSSSSEVILSHQCLKIWPKHAYLFSSSGDIPLMALQGIQDKCLFNLLNRLFPHLFLDLF